MKIIRKIPINKGWSKDKKYFITDENNHRYLLRISALSTYDTKKKDFEMMKQVDSFEIPMCKPIAFGKCADGVYTIQS